MQNKLSITLLTIILIITLTLTVHISLVNASPVTFNMDTLPENQGWTIDKQGNVASSVSNGILTIECNGGSLTYFAPADWINTVNYTKGWIVEFRLKLEHSNFSSGILIYIPIYDNFFLHTISLSEDGITVSIPAQQYLMNTTDTFHVYRLIGQGNILRVFVDGKQVLDLPYANSFVASGTMRIVSDMTYTKSYWDYISYDTNPNLTLTSPILTVIDGTSSYYICNLTGVTVDNSIVPMPNGTFAGWCVDKSVRMTRNEAHNIMLYNSTEYIALSPIGLYNWRAVNYIF